MAFSMFANFEETVSVDGDSQLKFIDSENCIKLNNQIRINFDESKKNDEEEYRLILNKSLKKKLAPLSIIRLFLVYRKLRDKVQDKQFSLTKFRIFTDDNRASSIGK